MRKQFTTGDITKITGRKKNTLKDDIINGLVTPSIHKAAGRHDRSLFSFEDVCFAFLTFQIMRYKKPSRKGVDSKKIRDSIKLLLSDLKSRMVWSQIGSGPGQYQYLINNEKFVEEPLIKAGGWKPSKKYPPANMNDNELMRVVFNLSAIKKKVTDWAKANPEDPA